MKRYWFSVSSDMNQGKLEYACCCSRKALESVQKAGPNGPQVE
jgi:hypothetical protein